MSFFIKKRQRPNQWTWTGRIAPYGTFLKLSEFTEYKMNFIQLYILQSPTWRKWGVGINVVRLWTFCNVRKHFIVNNSNESSSKLHFCWRQLMEKICHVYIRMWSPFYNKCVSPLLAVWYGYSSFLSAFLCIVLQTL